MKSEPTEKIKAPDDAEDALYRKTTLDKLKPGGELFLAFRDKHQLKILISILTEVFETAEPTAG